MNKLLNTPGFVGYVSQGLAILSLLLPKVALASWAILNAPYLFIVPFVLDYLLIIGYNKLMFGSLGGKFTHINPV